MVIEKFRAWLWAELKAGRISLEDLGALDGKVLGCWCSPKAGHGDVLATAARWAAAELETREDKDKKATDR